MNRNLISFAFLLFCTAIHAQSLRIDIIPDAARHRVTVTAGGSPFTSFLYPDTLEKPVLYPIYAPDGQIITRGFPLQPRPGDPTDHPHHIDFWNNAYAIPADKKNKYGWIRTDSVTSHSDNPNEAALTYNARWTDQQNTTLLTEQTIYRFTANAHERFIDRITTL